MQLQNDVQGFEKLLIFEDRTLGSKKSCKGKISSISRILDESASYTIRDAKLRIIFYDSR